MSKMVQVRNVPDDVHAALRQRAATAGVSMSEFILAELRRLVARPPLDEVLARAARRGGRLRFDDAVAALHEERGE